MKKQKLGKPKKNQVHKNPNNKTKKKQKKSCNAKTKLSKNK